MATQALELKILTARLAIERLNADFCYFLDNHQVAELAGLFTEDAYYRHGSRISRGREEIFQLFAARAQGVRTARHLQTGLRIDFTGELEARGQSVCLTFAADGSPPITPATPYLVADFIDQYRCAEDGCWRLSSRQIERVFVASENPGPVGLKQT